MNEHIISQQNMDTVKALAETTAKVSEAKNILFKLQEEETEYLIAREKKALTKINSLYEESKHVFKDIQTNYQGAQDILKEVTNTTEFLNESHGKFQGLLKDFEEYQENWDKNCKNQEEKWAVLKREVEVEKVLIKNEKESIERQKTLLEQEKRKIEDQKETIKRTIERLKTNKI